MSKFKLKIRPILIFSFVFITVLSLRVDTDLTPPTYSNQTYVKSLDEIQTKFENQINTLNQQINDINAIIQNANTSTSLKVTAITEKMADQRNSLYDVQQSLKLPYQFKLCQCRQLSATQKTRLQTKVTQINNNMTSLQQDVSQCPSGTCPNYNYIKQQLKNMKAYLSSITQILNSDCCHKKFQFKQQKASGIVNLGNSLFKDNLKAKNWFYGTTNEHDYKLKMFQLSTKYNITTCPIEMPFANYTANKCVKCQQEGAIFNIGVRSCYYCGKLAYLDQSTSLCKPCLNETFFNFKTNQCQKCAIDYFLNKTSQQCQKCPTGQFFDINANKCTSCPENNQYDAEKRICRPCNLTAAQFYNITSLKCQYCPNGYMYNTSSSSCQICPNNGYFNRQSASCIPCTGSLFMNPKTMTCQPCPYDKYFNSTMKKCVKCPVGFKFDSVFQKCIQITNNTNNTTPVNTTNITNPATSCPSDHPYYNKYLKTCQQCSHDQIYDYDLAKCVKNNNIGICPQDKPYYDIQNHQCIACPAGTVFNYYSYQCQTVSHHRHALKV